MCYTIMASNSSFGEKALVMKQFLSDEKVEEINEIIEMKMTHRKNIERRKAKFGFESDSKMGLNMVGAAVVVPDASDGTEPEGRLPTQASGSRRSVWHGLPGKLPLVHYEYELTQPEA